MEQEQFVGFDVSQAKTSVCVVDGPGRVVWQGKCTSTPEAMAAIVQRRARHASRIAIETSPMSAWHYRSLAALGLPVVCIDARHAKVALAMQLNKTDASDAVGLAQIVHTGWYREVAVRVAIARKLAVILHRMWADKAEFHAVPAVAAA